MAKKRKRYKPKSKGLLGAISLTPDKPLSNKELGLLVAAITGGTIVGISIPKPLYAIGVPVAILGVMKKNMYLTSAGIAMTLTGGVKTNTEAGIGDIEGLEGIKERLLAYFKNFGEGLPLPKQTQESSASNENMGDLGEEEVQYFTNPYNNQLASPEPLDFSQLDRIEQQIDAMNGDIGDLNF